MVSEWNGKWRNTIVSVARLESSRPAIQKCLTLYENTEDIIYIQNNVGHDTLEHCARKFSFKHV